MKMEICFACMDLALVLKVFGLLVLAILFLQSGIDKIKDWQGNLAWLKGHFANSPLKNLVPALLAVLTFQEIMAGACCLVGIFTYASDKSNLAFPVVGLIMGLSAFVSLFFGQRLAKDYPGAASLVPYMLFNAFVLYLFL